MTQATSCPSVPVLQRLLLGNSADEESVSLEAHLLHCDKCLQTIKSLPPDDALISSLQEGRDFATLSPRSELLEKLRVRLQEMAASARGADTSTGENTHPIRPTPSAEMMGHEIVALAPPQQPDEIGRLGGYRVLKELGRGGMGAVFQAEDPKLKRLVALKVMLPRLAADASARRRFLREAQAMAAVHHDHVVTIYQVDEDNGVPYLAMEFLHGTPLDKWLKDGRKPSLAQILRMGREIAEGLAAAHARGLIHRDIKPGNIWLDSDHKGRVKILDFGLARVGTDDVHLTHSGAIVGTPAYMSPEQGAGQKVEARTDLFSLGCVLYRFCTGAMPFNGDTTMALLTALALADPKPVREVNPETPAALADLVMRLLAKKPADRPASAQEVADQLAAIEQNQHGVQANENEDGSRTEVLAPESRPSPRLAKPKSRRRTAIFALMGAAAALIVAAAGAVIYVQTDKGTLEIKTSDPDVKVSVEQDGAQVDVLDAQSKQQMSIRSGTYTLRLTGGDGFEHEMILDHGTNPVTLTRGGKVVVEVRRVDKPTIAAAPAEGKAKSTFPPLDEGWVKLVASLPAAAQVEAVAAKLKERNPGFDGKVTPNIANGVDVTFLSFAVDDVADLTPLRAFPRLTSLWFSGFNTAKCRLTDLSPLKDLPLTELTFQNTAISDLSPLKDIKLTKLNFAHSPVSDLSPLKGMKLKVLHCDGSLASDLLPLKGMKLESLNCANTKVSDLSLLKEMPLKDLSCNFKADRDAEILRSIKTLETINGTPAAEFWKEVAAKPTFPPLDEAWVKKVRDLPAEKQVEEVAAELKRRNPGFDGKMTPTITDGEVTGLEMKTDDVADLTPLRPLLSLTRLSVIGSNPAKGRLSDLSPLKEMPLRELVFQYTAIADLTPLKDMKLTTLYLLGAPVSDLSPLKDMKLTYLVCVRTRISDLSPLKDMKLTTLNCSGTKVSDLSPLKGMPLGVLTCSGTKVSDLSPLKDMNLAALDCQGTLVSDLSPLKGMPLTQLECNATQVSDLSPLKDMKLTSLMCNGTQISDLSLLKDMPLKNLTCDFKPERDTEILRSIKTLETINNKPTAEFWKDVAAKPTFPPLDEAWAKKVRDLPAEKQVEEVAAELKRRNPGFDGKVTPSLSINSVVGLVVRTDDVADLTPLQALPQLENLDIRPSGAAKSRLSDLSTIRNLKLTALNCNATLVSDLSPLKDMKLTVVECLATPVHDLTPLKGMPLLKLDCNNTLVSDLSPLKDIRLNELKFSGTRVTDLSSIRGLPLTILECGNLPISDLSPLKDMKLTYLVCGGTRISDLSPLKGMPLTELNCTDSPVSDLSPLKDMKLTILLCNGTHVSDLSPLQGMELGQLACSSTPVADLSPLKGMPVKSLTCNLTRVSDLSPLKDMKLTLLECSGTRVSDLSPLQGMPLMRLGFNLTRVSDVSPLKGMPLTFLGCDNTGVFDLSPLRGMPLESLYCHDSAVTDLSPLQGIKLTLLWCSGTKATNLSPLKGMPLKELKCDFNPDRDTEILNSIKTLETINEKPAAEFWKDVDAKPAEKKP